MQIAEKLLNRTNQNTDEANTPYFVFKIVQTLEI